MLHGKNPTPQRTTPLLILPANNLQQATDSLSPLLPPPNRPQTTQSPKDCSLVLTSHRTETLRPIASSTRGSPDLSCPHLPTYIHTYKQASKQAPAKPWKAVYLGTKIEPRLIPTCLSTHRTRPDRTDGRSLMLSRTLQLAQTLPLTVSVLLAHC